jgi:hypothetical protein
VEIRAEKRVAKRVFSEERDLRRELPEVVKLVRVSVDKMIN